jgi:hypothetical protein
MNVYSEVMGVTNRRKKNLVSFLFVPEVMGRAPGPEPIAFAQFDIGIVHRRFSFQVDVHEARMLHEHLTKFLNSNLVQRQHNVSVSYSSDNP